MGIFDEIGKAMKKVEDEVKKAELDKRCEEIGSGITKAASGLAREADTTQAYGGQAPAPQAGPAGSATTSHRPHPGYSRITAWVKTRYQGRIAGVTDPYQQRLGLEQISSEATTGLSPKARKGFLEYLKQQNYEQLLK